VHAGVDDVTAEIVAGSGTEGLNERFSRMMEEDPIGLYYGPLGSAFRTKYRETDHPFTADGGAVLRAAGIHAVVHGHRRLTGGQRLVERAGLLHLECDCSLDASTRAALGLRREGVAATVFRPEGSVVLISADHAETRRLGAADLGGRAACRAEATPGSRSPASMTGARRL
jgi:uncharacterized Zn-binding protein involved in type VI secretion